MSGYNAKFLYDQCTFDQNLKSSIDPCKYQLLLGKYESDTMGITSNPCQGNLNKYGCNLCDINKNANIEAKWGTIGVRTDIESDLRTINRPNSRCVDLKYHPCGPDCNKQFCSKTCPNHIVVNTLICNRSIVPTNNRMPTSSGF